MATDNVGKVIQCKAAICWEPKKPLVIETIQVDPPVKSEVRIKVAYTGLCKSDIHGLNGNIASQIFPCVLGHEASGIVESVGEDVKSLEPGDHVLTCFLAQCKDCDSCRNPKSNICSKVRFDENVMSNDTSRMKTLSGEVIYHFCGTSTFSEYAVISEFKLAKINKQAPLFTIVPISCGFSTGYGAALNTAQIEPGDIVGVWGLGTVGLAAAYGAKCNGAAQIIGVDMNSEKFGIAKDFGCTDFLNPTEYIDADGNSKVVENILKITGGVGLDCAIECIGLSNTITDAFNSTKMGCGKTVVVGVPTPEAVWSTSPFNFIFGKSITGCFFGGYKSRDGIINLVEEYMENTIDLDKFITGTMKIEDINEACDLLLNGKALRTILTF